MTKVGRNHSCPCGSGQKYKHCCLARDEAAAVVTREQQRRSPPLIHASRSGWQPVVDHEGERFDQMSNGVLDLIDAGKFDEAEQVCHRLLDNFPDLPDGHMRFGQLFRARGEPKNAAQHLRLAAAVARSADDDPEMPLSLEREADSLDPPTS